MSFQDLVAQLQSKMENVDAEKMKGVNAVFQFDLSGDAGGVMHVKVVDGSAVLEASAHESPNIVISMSAEDFASLLEGKLNPTSAFMAGKVKVKGDMSLAMKLQGLLG